MPNYWRKVFLVYHKDIRDEFRTFDNLLATLIFGAMLVFIFSFAFQLVELQSQQAFPAVLWVSVFFSSMLAIQRSFAKEKDNGSLDALLLATGDRGIIFLAKFLCNFTVLVVFELVVVPLLWMFIGVNTVGSFDIALFIASLVLGSWGLAAIGTMLNGITIQVPSARLLFPILMFPLLIPLLIGVILCSHAALVGDRASVLGWLYALLAFDLLFTLVPLVLFDYVLEG
jgi:heme exporter protein B